MDMCFQVSQACEPVEGKGSKFIKTQRHSTEDVQRSKGVKRKQPEAEAKPGASPHSADATPMPDPAPTVTSTLPAQQEEKANACKPRGYQCNECQKKHQGHCGTEKAIKACLRRSKAIGPEHGSPAAPFPANARKPRGYQCEECQKRRQGHCGTERAVKACLRWRPAQTAQPGSPVPGSQVPHGASGAEAQGAALPKEEVPGRTLGIAAKLQALARRPSDAVEAAHPHNAAQTGQKLGLPGQQRGAPGRTTGRESLQTLHQPERGDTEGPKGKKQRTASKHASLSARASEQTLTDRTAAAKSVKAAFAEGSQAIHSSKRKMAAKGKHARESKAEASADTEEPSRPASATQRKASGQAKSRADDLNHDSTSTGPKHADSTAEQLGRGSAQGPVSKLRRLTKAGNVTAAKQASSATAVS